MPVANSYACSIYHAFTATYIIVVGDGSLTGRKATDDGKVEPGFLCSSGTILDLVQLCDGKADCESGDDETHPLCASNNNSTLAS